MLATILSVRCIFIKEKVHLLTLTALMILEGIFACTAAGCTQQLFIIAADMDLLMSTSPDKLQSLYYGYAWSLGIASTCFNVSHWMLAV